MHADWQSFLAERGAVIEASAVRYFDSQATVQPASAQRIFDLSQYGLLSVRGADAENFLQGQLSNDVAALATGITHLTSYSTPQGRMLAIMRAFRYEQTLQFLLPLQLLPSIRTRLSRYVLRAQVEIGCDDAELGRIALAGDNAGELLSRLGLPSPPTTGSLATDDSLCVMNVTAVQPCYILVAPYGRLMQIWRSAEAHVQPAADAAWRRLQIDAGIPNVYPATSEAFVPQMVNLELLGGIDFGKGCYTGQEIVARTQYLGRIKRRMFRFRCTSDAPLRAGDTITSDDGTDVGTIVDAAPTEADWHLLAVIRIDAVTQPLRHGSPGGPVLQRLNLPYDVPLPAD